MKNDKMLALVGAAAAFGLAAAWAYLTRGPALEPAARGGPRAGRPAAPVHEEEEPILGYDGMDRDTLVAWIRDADLDEDTLIRIHEYEATNEGRERVLRTVSEMLDT